MQDTPLSTESWSIITACLILSAPLVSTIVASLTPTRYSWSISLTAPALMLVSVVMAGVLFYNTWQTFTFTYSIQWLSLGTTDISLGILINDLTVVMILVVTIISFLVHLYSTGYMADDRAIKKYFTMLGFFTFSMLGIVLADNLLLIFIFWELVGFSSYMLIGHWTEQPENGKAANKAFIMNRIGDAGFLIGLFIIYTQTGTFQLSLLSSTSTVWTTAASLCIFCGVIGKSAQFPLLTWLPDAMAGPTPVSALIHAATMVAAGVFLLARVFFLFTPAALIVVAITGTITALIGAVSALYQFDIKKILAYSTISQLGFMVMAFGVGTPQGSMLHLFTHAFFKAGLFLAAGSIIHTLHLARHGEAHQLDVQDIRNLGGLRKKLPITFITFLLCGASLAGLPLFSGFQSKDLILSSLIDWAGDGNSARWIFVIAAFLISFFTVCYTFRLIWYVFIRKNISDKFNSLTIQEAPGVMRFPMIVLALGSGWWMVSFNPISFSGWFFRGGEDAHVISLLSGAWILLAFLVAFIYFRNKNLPAVDQRNSVNLPLHGFYLDKIYNLLIVTPVHIIGNITTWADKRLIDRTLHFIAYAQITLSHIISWCDRHLIDGTVNGAAKLANLTGSFTRSFQAGKIQTYIIWATLGLGALLLFLVAGRL